MLTHREAMLVAGLPSFPNPHKISSTSRLLRTRAAPPHTSSSLRTRASSTRTKSAPHRASSAPNQHRASSAHEQQPPHASSASAHEPPPHAPNQHHTEPPPHTSSSLRTRAPSGSQRAGPVARLPTRERARASSYRDHMDDQTTRPRLLPLRPCGRREEAAPPHAVCALLAR
jgi:hypothetical protein